MAVNESTSKIKLDVSDLKKGIQDAQRAIKLANSEFRAASAGMDKWSESADGLSEKIKATDKVLKAQKTILAAYEKQLEEIKAEYGEDSKQAQEFQIKVNNQKAVVNKTQKELDKYQTALDELGDESKQAEGATEGLNDGLKDTKGAAEKANEGFTVMKGALADLVSKGISAAVQGLKDLAKAAADAWKAYDVGADNIIKATGATGEGAEGLMDIYKRVSKTVPAEFSEIGSAIGEVNTRFGLTGDKLEALSTKFLKFANLNGTDVVSSIDTVQKALSAYNLTGDDAGQVMDVLNKVAQDTGVSVDTLAGGLVQNATAFQELGLSIEQSAVLMGQMEKSGANSEAVMAGLRKALKNATEDGKPLTKTLSDLEDQIKNSDNSTKALQATYDLFGKSGDQIFGAIQNGTLSFKDLDQATIDAGGSIDRTFADTQDAPDRLALRVQSLKADIAVLAGDLMEKYAPQIEKLFDDVTSELLPAVQEGIDWIVQHLPEIEAGIVAIVTALAVSKIVGIITGLVTAISAAIAATEGMTVAQAALNVVMSANPIGIVVTAIAALVAAFVVLWNKSEAFRGFWIGIWEGIKAAVEDAKNTISTAWGKIVSTFENLKRKISTAMENIRSSISNKINSAKSTVSSAVDRIKSLLSFSGLKKTVSDLFSSIKEKITSPITSAKETVSSAVETIKGLFPLSLGKIFSGIQLPHFKISGGKVPWGVGGLGTPPSVSVEWYKRGGVIDGARVIGVGEDGAEAVVPLERNRQWIAAVAKAMRRAIDRENDLGGFGGTRGGQTVNYNYVQNNTSPKALSRLEIYRRTRNQLAFAGAWR